MQKGKRHSKKYLFWGLVLVALFFSHLLKGGFCSHAASLDKEAWEGTKEQLFQMENENFVLELVDNYATIHLTDKKTGHVWSSSMSDPNFDLTKVNQKWQQKMNSLFTVNVTELAKGFGVIVAYDLAGSSYTAQTYPVEEGVGVRYDMPEAGVCIAVEIRLMQQGIELRIPQEEIEEYKNFSIVSIDIMPFFAGTVDDQEGYLLYPDGSGGLMRFDDPSHWNEAAKSYSIYGDIEKHESMKGYFEQSEPEVMLPVFGANYGKEGFVAYITSGGESSKITVVPSGNIIPANYIYGSFIYRRGFDDTRITTKSLKKYDAERINMDYAICYSILPEGEAEYTDMAGRYREYLLENGGLCRREPEERLGLALGIFMGIKEEGMIFDSFKSVTTFEQAQDILKGLDESIDGRINATLIGWTTSGYGTEPEFFPANRKLGGNRGLSELAEFAAMKGISLSLEANFLQVKGDASGYSKKNDVVYLNNYKILTDSQNEIRLLSPNVAKRNFESFLNTAKRYPLASLKLAGIGEMLYFNYGEKNTMSALECRQCWTDMLEQTKECFGRVSSGGGNEYVLSQADCVMDIPYEDCGYQMTTESVPFYQIVLHGYVDYSGQALNLSSDPEMQCLKYIEYGYLPYYEVTWESSEQLIHTDYNLLFTSQYEEWKSAILKNYQMMQEALGDVLNEEIVLHGKVNDNVYCTGYANGVKIYVNYGETAVSVDGVQVAARSYAVGGR